MSFMSEINEHSTVLSTLVDEFYNKGGISQLQEGLAKLSAHRKIIFSGMGSSLFVSELCALLLRKGGIDAVAVESNELGCNNMEIICKDTLLVAISQSGRSKELIALCDRARSICPIVAITNNADGLLAQYSSLRVGVFSGEEKFTASKSYTNSLAAALILSYCLLGRPLDELKTQLELCITTMAAMLADTDSPAAVASFMSRVENILYIGSGYSHSTACHSEIITAEAAKIFASRYTTGQFIHGPVEMIRDGYLYVIFDTNRTTEASVNAVAEMVLRYGGKLIHLSDRPLPIANANYHYISLPQLLPEVSPIVEILPVVLFLNQVGISRGLEPGKLSVVGK